MARRSTRILRRLLLGLLVVAVVVVAAFSWLFFWPLEGSVERLETLVPEGVDFVYAGSLEDVLAGPWVEENVVEEPFLPDLRDLPSRLEEELLRPLERQIEQPINDMIPLGLTRFTVRGDVFPGRTILSGRFCEGWGPERGRPLWPKEWLLLTQTTWKPRFIAALKHGFVRRRIGPGVEIEAGDSPGVWRLTLPGVAVTDTRQRSGCSEGFIIPPENVVWLVRVKDVLAFTNSKTLAGDVAELGRAGEAARSFADRPDFRLEPPPRGMAAAMDLRPLHGYLIRLLETGGPAAGLVGRFLTVRSLAKLNGTLAAPAPDQLRASARVLYQFADLAPGPQEVYTQPPVDVRSGIARLVPAQDTFAVLLLSTPPLHLLQSVWEEGLTPGDRDLVQDNLRRMNSRYRTMDEFFRELSERLGTTAAIAVGRLSDVFDRVEYPSWFSDPTTDPDPLPAVAILVTLRQSAEPEEVDRFLAERMPALGFRPEIRRVDYRGVTYSRLEIEQKSADFRLATPAYMLVQRTLVLANNEDYFRKIVDTLGGAPSLASDPTFQATLAGLPAAGQIGVFVDAEKLLRVPESAAPGAQPRGFGWDLRNTWVIRNRDMRTEAIRFRNERMQRYYDQRRNPTTQEALEVERLVEEHLARWQERYPAFLEEYRRHLLEYRRLRSFGAVLSAGRDEIAADLVFLVTPPEARPGPDGRGN